MADLDLVCNNPKCRKRLTNIAWITSCSHAFCNKDADISFLSNSQNDIECPACKTLLPEKHDIVKTELNPTEKFKSMVLAGLRPELIMDITNRALTFWQYQTFQEVEYQKSLLKQSNIKMTLLEENYETQINRLKSDLQKERRNKEVLGEDIKTQTRRITELQDRLVEKNHQVQNLMSINTKLRCNTAKSQSEDNATHQRKKFSLGPQALDDFVPQPDEKLNWNGQNFEKEFQFTPVAPAQHEGGNSIFPL